MLKKAASSVLAMGTVPFLTAFRPFEVVIVDEPTQPSVVLADQVKSLDWKVRKAIKKGTVPMEVIAETLGKLQTLL